MFYRRPHFGVAREVDVALVDSEVTSVFWSPAFEGPLVLDSSLSEEPTLVQDYYDAYRKFSELMNRDTVKLEWELQFRLKPGSMVSFNQRRLLHGRAAFTSTTGTRWLEGCYVGIDHFVNRFRTLHLKYGDGARGRDSALRVGDGSYD